MAKLKSISNKSQRNEGETFKFFKGYTDENGTLHSDFEVVEMTGADEEAMQKSDVKTNSGKVMRTILERCIIRIGSIYKADTKTNDWREIIQNLAVGDQDYALLMIRKISVGDEITSSVKCINSECKSDLTHILTVDEIERVEYSGNSTFDFELPRGYVDKDGEVHKTGKMRHPVGLDREILDNVMKRNIGVAETMLITRCIVELEGVSCVTDDMIRNLSIADRKYLLKQLQEEYFGLDLTAEFECPNCGEVFTGTLNITDFF